MEWTILWLCLVASVSTELNGREKRSTATNIQHGLQLMNSLGSYIQHHDFAHTHSTMTSSLSAYLGIVGPLMSFLAAHHTASAEVNAIKILATSVDHHLDYVDPNFSKVMHSLSVSNANVRVHLLPLEQKIHAVNSALENMYKHPSQYSQYSKVYKATYQSDYTNSGLKLYNMVSGTSVFGGSIFHTVETTSNHRRADCRAFMLGVLRLLIQAAREEMAYHHVVGTSASTVNSYKQQWISHMNNVNQKMMATDKTCNK